MSPTHDQYTKMLSLCTELRLKGASVTMETRKVVGNIEPVIMVVRGKIYRFSDPSWEVVNKQLACLVNTFAITYNGHT